MTGDPRARDPISHCPACGGSVTELAEHHWPNCPRLHAKEQRRELAAFAGILGGAILLALVFRWAGWLA